MVDKITQAERKLSGVCTGCGEQLRSRRSRLPAPNPNKCWDCWFTKWKVESRSSK